MKILLFPALFFLLSIIAGYSNELVPRFYSLFSNQLHFSGKLADFEMSCGGSVVKTEAAVCKKAYLIKNPAFSSNHNQSMAIGFVLRAVGSKCFGQEQYIETFDSLVSPGTDRAESNKYKLLNLSKYQCEKIVVEAWSQKDDSRFGWIGGPIFYGETSNVKSVVKAIDFYANDFRLIIACFLVLVSLFGFITRIRYHSSVQKFNFELAVPFFAFVSLLNSGTIGKILPIFESPVFQSSLSIFLSTAGTFVAIFGFCDKHKLLRIVGSCFLAIISISQFSSILVGPINIILALIAMSFCIFKRQNVSVFLFSLLVIFASLKLMGVPFLPHSHVHMIFLGAIVFWNFSNLTAKILNYNRFLIVENSAIFQNSKILSHLLSVIAGDLRALRVSVFSIVPGSGCKVYSYTDVHGFKEFNLTELPPIIAHAVSTGESIWHLDSFSKEFENIKKSLSSAEYKGRFVTILPLFSGGSIVGTLAITDYSSIVTSEVIERINFQVLSQLASRVLSEILKSYQMSINDEKIKTVLCVDEKLTEVSLNIEDQHLFLSKSLSIIVSEFKCRGFIAVLNQETRALVIQSMAGYDEDALSLLGRTQFYAHKNNFHGPAPLAINSKKPVVVEDLNWLTSVLKSKTTDFFKGTGATSCLAIPIFSNHLDEPWGLLWLDSEELSFFKNMSIPVFQQLSALFSAKLSFVLEKSTAEIYRSTLSGFLPSEQILKVTKGHDTKEQDTGYLLMCDIKQSTKLSTLIGSEQYLPAAEELSRRLAGLLGSYGWSFQDFEWDAFYFSKSSFNCISSEEHFLDELLVKIENIFLVWQKDFFSPEILSYFNNIIKFRVCICFGDISRGISSGANKRWTIVGSTIAVISKLEAKIKKEDGQCFIVEGTYKDQSNWLNKNLILESVNKNILVFKGKQKSDKKKAA